MSLEQKSHSPQKIGDSMNKSKKFRWVSSLLAFDAKIVEYLAIVKTSQLMGTGWLNT